MMKVLNIVRSEPDDVIKTFIEAFSQGENDKAISLYEKDVDWSNLVDEIFAYDKVICWW